MRTPLLGSAIALLLALHGTGLSQPPVFRWDFESRQTGITWTLFYTRMATDNTVTQGEAVLQEIDVAQCQARSRKGTCNFEGNEYAPDISSTTRCGTLACPGPGAYTFGLRANDGEASTNPADLASIGFTAQCQCIPFRDAILDTETPTPPATPAPDPAAPTQEPRAPAPLPPRTPTPPPVQAGVNLVTAPTAQQPWHSGSYAGTQTQTGLDPSVQREGHATQKLTGRGDYFAQTTSPAFPVEPGRTYDVAAWVKLQAITKLVEVDVFYWDAHGNPLNAWGEAIGGRLTGTHDWTPLQGEVTVPPGAVTAVVQVRVMSRGGAAWVDAVTMRAQQDTGVVAAAPPREPEHTPVPPQLPDQPAALVALTQPVPAQTLPGLRKQFTALAAEYQTAQQTIRAHYQATLHRLANDTTPEAQQQREQAHATGTQALSALYQVLEQYWRTLTAQWRTIA